MRVQACFGLVNFGAIAAGIALSWDKEDLTEQIIYTIGTLGAAAIVCGGLVYLWALISSPHKILKDRVMVLEAPSEKSAQTSGAQTVINQSGGTLIVHPQGTGEGKPDNGGQVVEEVEEDAD